MNLFPLSLSIGTLRVPKIQRENILIDQYHGICVLLIVRVLQFFLHNDDTMMTSKWVISHVNSHAIFFVYQNTDVLEV